MAVDQSVSGYSPETKLGWLKVIGLIPVLTFIELTMVLAIVGSSAVFEPPYLFAGLNTLFITAISFVIAVLCWRGYVRTGAVRILMIGCGMITLGLASLAAGFATGFPNGHNLTPTIHNTGALVAASFITIASLLAVQVRLPHGPPAHGRVYAATAYVSTLIIVALCIIAAFRGWIPPFFLQDSGYTLLRMFVLGAAIALFALSSTLFLLSFVRWSGFTYWYGLGLALITVGLIGAFLAITPGTPLVWVSRVASYTGCIYMLFGISSVARISHLTHVPFADAIVKSFSFSLENYKTLVEIATDAIVVIDAKGGILAWNPYATETFGYTEKEAIGALVGYLIFPYENATLLDNELQRIAHADINTGGSKLELKAARKTGEVLFVELSVAARKIGGEWIGELIIRDITARKQAEKQLAESMEWYRDLFENSGTGIAILDENGRFLMANKRVAASFKKAVPEIVGMSLFDFLPQETAERYLELNRQLLRTGGQQEHIDTFVLPTGERTLLMVDTCLKDENGKYFAIQHSSIDITEKRRVEEELKESEEKFRNVFDNSAIAKSITSFDGTARLNLAFANMLGYTKEELSHIKWQDITYPDDIDETNRFLEPLQAGRENSTRFVKRYVKKDTSIVWADVNTVLQRDNDGKPLYYITAAVDITDRKLSEEAILKSKILLQSVIDSTPDWMYVKDLQHKFLLVNKSFAQAQNVSPKDMIDRPDTDFFSQELCLGNPDRDIIGYHADDNQAFQGHVVHNPRNIITWADGSQHTYDTYKIPLTDQTGKIYGVLVYSRDITQQSQAEEALKKSEERFKNMASLLPQVIFEADEKSNFTFINRQGLEMFGYSEAEAAGMNVLDTIIPQDRPRAMENIGARIKGQNFLSSEYTAVKKDGSTFPVTIYASPIMLNSMYAGMRGILVDITDRKNMETELRASHEEMRALAGNLQMAMEAERKRIARMIHDDLAQTLTALQIELAGLTHKLPADQKRLSSQAAAMNKLITLMDERVKHITTELRPPLLDDLGLCAAVKLSLNEFSKRTGIRHELHCEPEDFPLDTDIAIALFRVLQESLTNVTRHAEADMVTVHLKKLPDCVSLQVKDNGKGIEKRELANKKSIGIMGMRERVGFFGGKMRITSPTGGGTTIDVKIPLGQEVTP